MRVRGRAVAPLVGRLALAVSIALARPARAQDTPQLPPPPPPSSPPQYTPPPTPAPAPGPATTQPPPRHEREREPPPRRDREKERDKEREKEREREIARQRSLPPPPPPPPPPVREGAPPAARWLQIGLRTGISIPTGNISGDPNDGMGRDFNAQVPLLVEAGVKVHRMIFLGAYGGFAIGGVSSTFASAQGCTGGAARSCGALDLRVGFEMQVHFDPASLVNPWLGYGLGFESSSASASGGGAPSTGESFTGFEFARLGGGVDFRVHRFFGMGPFAEIDFGQYTQEHVTGAQSTVDQSLPNTSLHEWITLGVRGVIFP